MNTNFSSAWRNLLKNKTTSLINIFGLTIGIASAVLAILYAKHELTYEMCHTNVEKIHKVCISGDFGRFDKINTTFGPEGQELMNLFPEIENFSVSENIAGVVWVGQNVFSEDNILLADSNLFSLFTIPFTKGQITSKPLTLVISENTAHRYFGDGNPIGQFINLKLEDSENIQLTVTGVYKDFPSNTHLNAEFIIPSTSTGRISFWKPGQFNSTSYNTYVLLSENINYKALNKKIIQDYKLNVLINNVYAFIMPLKELHFNGFFDNNKAKLLAFLIGGFFVLITSILNYINLTNIVYFNRKKEIGIRKVNGGIWRNIFNHFISDTAFITLICFVASLIMVTFILPWFNKLMDTHINLVFSWEVFAVCISIYLITVLLSGIYPALRFSFLKPVKLITNETSGYKGSRWSRYLMTSFQIILSMIFIQFILVIKKQSARLENQDITGYNSENVICTSGDSWGDLNLVRNELLKDPNIESVSWGNKLPSMGLSNSNDWLKKGNKISTAIYRFDDDYLKVFDIKMREGRFYSKEYPSDKNDGVVISKETVDILGYMDPIGKKVLVHGKNRTIIGIVDSYMSNPPIFEKSPIIILPDKGRDDYLIIKVKKKYKESTHEYITKVLKSFNPTYPINLQYHYDYIYSQKEARSFITTYMLMNLFFYLTIIMTLVGLFGMSIFISNRNIKEIGIRKVCGASAGNMINKLLYNLIIQSLIAVCIATPLVYMFSQGYLSTFPNSIKPGFLFYFSGGGIAIVLMLLTVSWQTLRSAKSNPVIALRYE